MVVDESEKAWRGIVKEIREALPKVFSWGTTARGPGTPTHMVSIVGVIVTRGDILALCVGPTVHTYPLAAGISHSAVLYPYKARFVIWAIGSRLAGEAGFVGLGTKGRD